MASALVLAIGVALGLTAVTAAPAQACSCAPQELADQYASADAVFTARLVSRTVDRGWWSQGGGDPAHLVLAVDGVLKGEVHERQGVETVAETSACGLEIRSAGLHLVFAERGDGGLSAYTCNGTTALTPRLEAQIGELAADASAPLQGSAGLPTDSPWPGPLQIGGGAALLLLLTAVVLRRRSRRSVSALGPGHWLWG